VTFLLAGRLSDVTATDVVDDWLAGLDEFCDLIADRFTRSEPRERVPRYLCGLMASLGRRNGWTIAEHADEVCPDGMQRLLRWADWDVDGVRDDLRDLVIEYLGDADAVLVGDDTGFLKKGTRSAGVQRQYSGTAGRRENCQVGVFLAYVSDVGHVLIDRQLYLPESWTEDRGRCRAAGVPDEVPFTTKPQMMLEMLARVVDAGVPFGWFSADEAYGHAGYVRLWLEEHGIKHVVAVQSSDHVALRDRVGTASADEVIAGLAQQAWQRFSVGDGAHGPRLYDWARVQIRPVWEGGFGHWLLARRSISDPEEIAYYVCYAPQAATLHTLAYVAGKRWPVEECFQQAKNETGLDQYQVRNWRAWYAHITLSMAAHALLVIAKVQAAKGEPIPRQRC
jgi:SRSO17 transposase